MRSTLNGLTCAGVRKEVQGKIAELEAARNQARICADERSRVNALSGDLDGLRSAMDGLTCASVREQVRGNIAELEAARKQAQICADERSRVNAPGSDLVGLRSALDRLTCADVREEVRGKIAEAERANKDWEQVKNSSDPEELLSFAGRYPQSPHASEAKQRAANLEADWKQAQICLDERSRMAALGDDLPRLRTALEGLTCRTVQDEFRPQLAKLESVTVCANDLSSLGTIDPSVVGAHDQLTRLRDATTCGVVRERASTLAHENETLVHDVQVQLGQLGCYTGTPTGIFDAATKQAFAAYSVKTGTARATAQSLPELISELRAHSEAGLCAQPPVAEPVKNPHPSVAGPPRIRNLPLPALRSRSRPGTSTKKNARLTSKKGITTGGNHGLTRNRRIAKILGHAVQSTALLGPHPHGRRRISPRPPLRISSTGYRISACEAGALRNAPWPQVVGTRRSGGIGRERRGRLDGLAALAIVA